MSGNQRNPKDLQGLLKFCMEATHGEDAPAAEADMDEERLQWFQEALNSMSVDVIEQLGNGIKILNSQTVDVDEKEEALDRLEDWLGNIDMAINFHKIGGYSSLKSCLESEHASLRSGAAHIIAEIGQNNTYCQEKFLEDKFIDLLANQLDTDSDQQARVKALYAISCLCREFPAALKHFSQSLDGWSIIVRGIQASDIPKLRTKACFFLSACMNMDSKLIDEFVSLGLVLQLASILQEPTDLTHEHVLQCLCTMLHRSTDARREVFSLKSLQFEELLKSKMKDCEDRDDLEECRQHCTTILNMIGNKIDEEDAVR